jgi:phosphohistidine phosphatase
MVLSIIPSSNISVRPALRPSSSRCHRFVRRSSCTSSLLSGSPTRVPGSDGSKTTRKIILMRHADSEENNSGIRDHDRSITAQGKAEAEQIAVKLSELNWLPDLIIASNARRTRQTLDEMATAVSRLGEVDAHFLGSLYTVAALDGQTRAHLEECIAELADASDCCVMCIGHNKGWEEAASSMVAGTVRLKTATAALLQHEGAWADILHKESQWQLVDLVSPEL